MEEQTMEAVTNKWLMKIESDDKSWWMGVNKDGSIEGSEGWDAHVAAKNFWAIMGQHGLEWYLSTKLDTMTEVADMISTSRSYPEDLADHCAEDCFNMGVDFALRVIQELMQNLVEPRTTN